MVYKDDLEQNPGTGNSGGFSGKEKKKYGRLVIAIAVAIVVLVLIANV